MRYLAPLFAFLAVAAFHTVLSASLEAAKEEKAAKYDGLAELQKIDEMEFEAAQKNQAAHTNATEDQTGDSSRYLEAAQDQTVEEHVDSEDGNTAEGGGNSDAAAQAESESESTEDIDGSQRQEHHEVVTKTAASLEENTQDSTKDQDVLE